MNLSSFANFTEYPPQAVKEFEQFCSIIRHLQPRSILEVGSRHGRSLLRLAEAALPTLRSVVSIDMPDMAWGKNLSDFALRQVIRGLLEREVDADLLQVDSHGPQALHFAKENRGAFDLIFIDGDHSYDGVQQDYLTFRDCLTERGLIAFHDINGDPSFQSRGLTMGVPRFWEELKRSRDVAELVELIDPAARFGIGVARLKKLH